MFRTRMTCCWLAAFTLTLCFAPAVTGKTDVCQVVFNANGFSVTARGPKLQTPWTMSKSSPGSVESPQIATPEPGVRCKIRSKYTLSRTSLSENSPAIAIRVRNAQDGFHRKPLWTCAGRQCKEREAVTTEFRPRMDSFSIVVDFTDEDSSKNTFRLGSTQVDCCGALHCRRLGPFGFENKARGFKRSTWMRAQVDSQPKGQGHALHSVENSSMPTSKATYLSVPLDESYRRAKCNITFFVMASQYASGALQVLANSPKRNTVLYNMSADTNHPDAQNWQRVASNRFTLRSEKSKPPQLQLLFVTNAGGGWRNIYIDDLSITCCRTGNRIKKSDAPTELSTAAPESRTRSVAPIPSKAPVRSASRPMSPTAVIATTSPAAVQQRTSNVAISTSIIITTPEAVPSTAPTLTPTTASTTTPTTTSTPTPTILPTTTPTTLPTTTPTTFSTTTPTTF
eukprot:scpid61308/ scgid19906/ 